MLLKINKNNLMFLHSIKCTIFMFYFERICMIHERVLKVIFLFFPLALTKKIHKVPTVKLHRTSLKA